MFIALIQLFQLIVIIGKVLNFAFNKETNYFDNEHPFIEEKKDVLFVAQKQTKAAFNILK